ncbi:MAG TPA: substrate-binding domain-containing protein, partial [Gemmataceae bacterium]|nr:substrate-binding domain-containing protein [Gemmataceae bacterium]
MKQSACVLFTALAVAICGCPKGNSDNNSGDGKPVYVILDTWTDGFDRAKAKQKAQDAMTRYPNLGCMVGLFAYNPPICLDAVRDADKLGKIQIVAFDENDDTLKGIKDGHIFGSIVQNPYKYGFESVRVLAALAKGDKTVVPKDGMLPVPERVITKDKVDEYWETLKKQTAG